MNTDFRRIIDSAINQIGILLCRYSYQARRRITVMESLVGPGRTIKIPVFHTAGLGNLNALDRDRWFRRLIPDIVSNRRGCFIDVGANRGQTLINATMFIPDTRYIAFEPNIACCYYLQKLVAANGLRNISIIPCGIGESVEVCQLSVNNTFDDSGTLHPELRGQESFKNSTTVLLLTGDEMVRKLQISEIAAVKIDVEGAELEVLKGLVGTIDKFSPPIIFEVLPYAHLNDSYYNELGFTVSKESRRIAKESRRVLAEGINSFFHRRSYRIFRIDQNDGTLLPIGILNDPENYDCININYLAVHEAQQSEYERLIRLETDASAN